MSKLVQTAVALRDLFDNTADGYDSVNDTLADRVHALVNKRRILETLSGQPVTTVLDAGGGTGTWAVMLAEMALDVTLVDISPRSVQAAKAKARSRNVKLDARVGDIEQTEIPSWSFDFVLCQGPLSYTPHPNLMLTEMHRLLKPGGLIWLDFYNAPGWALENTDVDFKLRMSAAEEELIQMSDWDYPARVFSISRVRGMCENTGLEVLRVYGSHVLMASFPHEKIYVHQFAPEQIDALAAAELRLGARRDCVGLSKIVQIVAKRT